MSRIPTADYLTMARSMKYGDLVKKLLRRWNKGSLGAGLLLYLYS
ncbi:hypothetical protein LCGC14_0318200 [marine sediment metagenome]|uniref:Uncharacterized protein n=1 Tax=marine sediment metagenome TaxID=412755 RepID=A0A0F9W7B1_9ZZZZ